ncbi:MAG: aminoacetone oxidase family FAD-binding enzyme [Clostridia bacterium]|nr:aminoacetone oxidase family FAD-binding enzyme [Clostridia bacterium]
MQTDCIILGGGAGGLAAACALADTGLRITIVERLDRVGKKLLAAGNGRCNITNTDMRPEYYAHAEGFVRAAYQSVTPQDVHAFFSSLGLMTAEEDGRVYPRSMMAASVLDVLRAGCTRENVRTLTSCEVTGLSPSRRGGFSVQLDSGEGLFAPVVVATMGGAAAPSMGTDGSGARLMQALGHEVTPLHPALVQLRCDHPALRSLKGLRTHAEVSLRLDGKTAAVEDGELLFADYGVSGVCIFQLSRFVGEALAKGRQVCLSINLLPEIPEADRSAWLDSRIRITPGSTALGMLTGVFPRILSLALLREAGIHPDSPAAAITAAQRRALHGAVFSLAMPVTGTQGFRNAQVTRGGVSLDDVNPATMASRLYDGLYLCGELLDVDGPCGGYNLHFAFASALAAAKDIKKRYGLA